MSCLNDTKVYLSWMKVGLGTFEQEKITEIWKLVPPETEKLQKEIRPCHLLVALLADNIDQGIKPRDASTKSENVSSDIYG